ncbi:MAG: class I SAM-dependent methyltransferase [Catenulispora sp.]|nr:class I SAM-dependent methyltransferase [Catenulispora sp.]
MKFADYEAEQYQNYARGRALTERQLQTWISAFRALLPPTRPLAGLDVGSGTGRYSPALADAFGPVTGVEPAARMREQALTQSRHPAVRYLAGSAEELPVESGSADYAVLMQSWHHVQDQPGAARELVRAVKPGGRLLMHSGHSDHMPRIWWLEQFPRGPEVDASMFRPLHEAVETLTSAGWRVISFGTVEEPSSGSRAELLDQLRLRTHSVFELFTAEEVETGFRRLEHLVAQDPDAPVPGAAMPLLALERR